MTRSNFTESGLPIGSSEVNMTYLYGISDFFTVMFEDPSTVNLLLEATTQEAADVYSRFLQLCSTISLEDISRTIGSSIKLSLVNSTDAVPGQPNAYYLADTVLASKYVANRPLLPTKSLEEGVDFVLETDDQGRTKIIFAQSIDSYAFSVRPTPAGGKQFAVWFVDAEVDERFIYNYYGRLIGVDAQNSTETYKNFVYGLFYVYVQGPTLDVMRKGLNLTLGIPLARAFETVIDIRMYLDTDQYVVITDQNQYLIPYGLPASVAIGDVLQVGDELAQWVEIKDYIHDGEWWLNLQIPPSIIPTLPAGQKDRYATEGSHFDYLMRNYLKKHTFLVNINVADFKNNQTYQQLADIIKRAKPSYTQPIYIWTIDSFSETLTLRESTLTRRVDPNRCEPIGLPIDRFYRNNSEDAPIRSCPQFLRFNVPYSVAVLCGTDPYVNGDPTSLAMNGAVITGRTNYALQFRMNTTQELAWIKTIMNRSSENWRGKRSLLGFRKNLPELVDDSGTPVNLTAKVWGTPVGRRFVPLYVTTTEDIKDKSDTLGVAVPAPGLWHFPLFGAGFGSQAINTIAINDPPKSIATEILRNNFNLLFYRGAGVGYLTATMPEQAWRTFAPTVSDIRDGDYLIGIRITPSVLGVYWVTSNFTVDSPSYFPITVIDPLTITYNRPLTRGGGLNGTPFYAIRGRGTLNYNNVRTAINAAAINAMGSVSNPELDQVYTDKYNPVDVPIDRSGTKLVHAIESR